MDFYTGIFGGSGEMQVCSLAILLFFSWLLSSCSGFATYYYYPMAGLQDPSPVRLTSESLSQISISLHCLFETTPEDRFVNPKTKAAFKGDKRNGAEITTKQEASKLCEKLESVFTQLGASVTIRDSESTLDNPSNNKPIPNSGAGSNSKPILVEVVSLHTTESVSVLYYPLFASSFGFFPLESAARNQLRVRIADASGSLLQQKEYEARFSRVISPFYALANTLVNYMGREKFERVTIDNMHARFSADIFSHLVQEIQNVSLKNSASLE